MPDDMDGLPESIRQHFNMLAAFADSQARIEMKQDQILLAIDGLTTAIEGFCAVFLAAMNSTTEKESQS